MSGLHDSSVETDDRSAISTSTSSKQNATGVHPRRKTRAAVVTGLAAAVLAVPVAHAAGPTSKPVPNTTSTLAAKHACPFKVIDKTLPDSRRVETIFRNGRHLITGPARERLTNAENGASIVVNSSGTISYKKGADGRTHYRFRGPSALYFFPGDQGPFGTVGENGALYHVVGKVGETLAKNDVVTAFVLRGRATELCSKIA